VALSTLAYAIISSGGLYTGAKDCIADLTLAGETRLCVVPVPVCQVDVD
jgi:hypothetical protein